jgi:thiosulfate/3-mercaptopyruvate sulfurtransferase
MRLVWGVVLFSALAWCQTIDPADTLKPAELAARIDKASGKPGFVLLHVGFPVLYRGAHIKDSAFAGPGSKPDGLEALKKAVDGVPKDREIILYCGCCPWEKCPNIRPAYAMLHDMGYRKVRTVMIPENLAKDWIDKGYPTTGRNHPEPAGN